MVDDESSPYYMEETWSKGLTRENTLEKMIGKIAVHYSEGEWDEFEWGIKSLVTLLPKSIRDNIELPPHDIHPSGREEYYKCFVSIQEKLESDTNMIWKKKFIKTYE